MSAQTPQEELTLVANSMLRLTTAATYWKSMLLSEQPPIENSEKQFLMTLEEFFTLKHEFNVLKATLNAENPEVIAASKVAKEAINVFAQHSFLNEALSHLNALLLLVEPSISPEHLFTPQECAVAPPPPPRVLDIRPDLDTMRVTCDHLMAL